MNCSDYGIPQNRKRLFIVGFHRELINNLACTFEFPPKIPLKLTLSDLLNQKINSEIARTIRVGGRGSPLGNRHNWDGYTLLNSKGTEYRLSIRDCLLLQNFPKTFQLCGCKTNQYKQLGNTIPTNLSFVVGEQIIKYLKPINYFQTQKRNTNSKKCKSTEFHKNQGLNYGELGEFMIKDQLICFQNQHICTPFGYIQKLENEPSKLIQNKKLTLFKLHSFQNF